MFSSFNYKVFFNRHNFANAMSKKAKQKGAKKEAESMVKEEGPVSVDKSNNIIISILAKPGAKQSAVTNFSSEGIGVQISAPPTEGEANTELIRYMASVLGLRKSDVTLERGFKSRNKVLKITASVTIDDIKNKLLEEIQDS